MEEPLIVLKPNLINALFPVFMKNLWYSVIIVVVLLGIIALLKILKVIAYTYSVIFFWMLIVLVVIAVIPMVTKLIVLANTHYYFFRDHLISEFEFINIKRQSLPYHQIVNISTRITLWDRLCKAGDITLHTAEDKTPDLILWYIKNPSIVEAALYKMVRTGKFSSANIK